MLLECAREGGTVVVTRIDRLARPQRDLQNLTHELEAKGVSPLLREVHARKPNSLPGKSHVFLKPAFVLTGAPPLNPTGSVCARL